MARSAGFVQISFAVLQGRLMRGNTLGIPAGPQPVASRSRMKRPFRTPDDGHGTPALRAGLL